MKPRAKKNANAMSHGISDDMALKACANVRVPVRIVTPRASRATAPRGKGPVMIPVVGKEKEW